VKCAALALVFCWSACSQSGGLERKLEAAAPSGLAWAIVEMPMVAGHGTLCSFWDSHANHNLEMRRNKIYLDGPRRLRLLFRLQDRKIERLHLASEDCQIEPGSQTLIAFPNASPGELIDYLATRSDDSALLALSLLDHPDATPKLIALAKDRSNERRQKKAFFWLARSKNPAALAYIDNILR
jgi:hypothetical protein